MIHQSAFNDVVTLLNKNQGLGKGMVFEKAYAGIPLLSALFVTPLSLAFIQKSDIAVANFMQNTVSTAWTSL